MDETYTLTRSWKSRVVVGVGASARLGELLEGVPDRALLVYDGNVPPESVEAVASSLGEKIPRVALERVRAGEEMKGLEGLLGILDRMQAEELTRASLLVGMGGGSLLDTVGFAASIYMRGIGFASVPTTLLAQADAGLGGKTGINLGGKNLIGSFHPPTVVAIDPLLSTSQDDESFRQGFAEIVKHGFIQGGSLLSLLEEGADRLAGRRDAGLLARVLGESARVKMEVVSRDPWETRGLRVVLNLGHTIAHALERASGYRVPHGSAVSVGLVGETIIAGGLVGTDKRVVERLEYLLSAYGLPTYARVEAEEVARHIGGDKKRRGDELLLPLIRKPGDIVVERVSLSWLRKALVEQLKGSVLA